MFPLNDLAPAVERFDDEGRFHAEGRRGAWDADARIGTDVVSAFEQRNQR